MKKITFIDIAIILVVVAIVFGAYYYLSSEKIIHTGDDDATYSYQLRISRVEKNIVDEINKNDVIFDSAKLIEIGKISNVEVKPHADVYADTINGGYTKQVNEELFDIVITVESANASLKDGTVYVNNYELFIGKNCFVRGDNFANSATVVAMGEWGAEK